MAVTESEALRRLEVAHKRADIASEQLHAARLRKKIRCVHCGKRTMVSKMTFIQTHWYVAPYGCTGGDYWSAGEGAYDCPKCGERNRLYDRPEVEKLKSYFAEIKEEY